MWGGYYEPGSLIWRSRWVTDDAMIECREALALPSDPGRAVILRRVHRPRGHGARRRRAEPARRLRREPAAQALKARRRRVDGRARRHTRLLDGGPGRDAAGRRARRQGAHPRARRSRRASTTTSCSSSHADGADLEAAGPRAGMAGRRGCVARAGSRARGTRRAARRASRLRGARRADQRGRRDGRRGDDLAARARARRTQL